DVSRVGGIVDAGRRGALGVSERHTTRQVGEESAAVEAKAGTQGALPVDGVGGVEGEGVLAADIGPGDVADDAEHQARASGDVEAGVDTDEPAIEIEVIVRGIGQVIGSRPATADEHTDKAAIPAATNVD